MFRVLQSASLPLPLHTLPTTSNLRSVLQLKLQLRARSHTPSAAALPALRQVVRRKRKSGKKSKKQKSSKRAKTAAAGGGSGALLLSGYGSGDSDESSDGGSGTGKNVFESAAAAPGNVTGKPVGSATAADGKGMSLLAGYSSGSDSESN